MTRSKSLPVLGHILAYGPVTRDEIAAALSPSPDLLSEQPIGRRRTGMPRLSDPTFGLITTLADLVRTRKIICVWVRGRDWYMTPEQGRDLINSVISALEC